MTPMRFLLLAALSAGCTGSTSDAAKEGDDPTDDSGFADADGDGAAADVDCNDDDAAIFPGAEEVCDLQDNDCNGDIDDNASDTVTVYVDADQDGYGDPTQPVESCSIGEYAVIDTDCDDTDATLNPGIDEVCDGIDNDCDGEIDEAGESYYLDLDGDGYGGDDSLVEACETPEGYIDVGGDCDDESDEISPDAVEICDEVDNDCNGTVDDAADGPKWYPDVDSDGYVDVTAGVAACVAPEGLYGETDADCDDTRADVHPDAAQTCEGIDADCDGAVDGLNVPAAFPTISGAVATAVDGDIVCVAAGTYMETLDFDGKMIEVHGADRDTTIIDGGGVGPVVRFDSGEGVGSVLSGVTVTGGVSDKGAGVYMDHASPALNDVLITGNACIETDSSCYGAGMYVRGNGPTLTAVEIADNTMALSGTAYAEGGGFYADYHSSTTVSGVMVYDNAITCGDVGSTSVRCYGGGISLNGSAAMSGDGLVVSGNSVTIAGSGEAWGGGLNVQESSVLTIDDLSVARNTVSVADGSAYGGGICVQDIAELYLSRAWVGENAAEGTTSIGGGIYAVERSIVTIDGGIVLGNSAAGADASGAYGGGLNADQEAIVTLTSVVVAGNDATASDDAAGGGFWLGDVTLALNGVVVYANTAAADSATGGAISREDGDQTVGYCDVFGNSAEAFNNVDALDSTNLTVDPEFADTTSANPAEWDVHLAATSPLVDMGDTAEVDPDGTRADMGAYGIFGDW